ncbi:hypothetical protein NCCP1664_14260 [Zafaria cholistanensis]|uniref:Uncharacterized protein n=1 Tax=Zafaria cholistanensis TaxID=1682741 RepID=A0A5A7NQE7_9MICC|nr:hypothetical protein NCCP1664_14260 [Zafaria cholistanensis]
MGPDAFAVRPSSIALTDSGSAGYPADPLFCPPDNRMAFQVQHPGAFEGEPAMGEWVGYRALLLAVLPFVIGGSLWF